VRRINTLRHCCVDAAICIGGLAGGESPDWGWPIGTAGFRGGVPEIGPVIGGRRFGLLAAPGRLVARD
jgi:hypothetical protein